MGTSALGQSEPERRHLTVLFCDLVGSTQLSTSVDPEDLGALIATYRQVVAEAVHGFEGEVARFIGDGVLAYFGFPTAHEDDAERAVRAALQIVRSVGKRTWPDGYRPQVRIGIATGTVTTGQLSSSIVGPYSDGIFGETPNLAARLQQFAEPDTIVIAALTHRLVGSSFDFVELGPTEIRGISEPVRFYRVIGINPVQSRFQALRSLSSAGLVARDREMDWLRRHWRNAARDGAGSLTLLRGEAGIGKSRMVEILSREVGDDGANAIFLQCSPYHTGSALYPLINHLEQSCGAPDDQAADKLRRLQSLLSGASITADADIALLAELVALPDALRTTAFSLGAVEKRRRTIALLIDYLRGLARAQPVLLVIEDIHWIDPTTDELIQTLAQGLTTEPMLVLCTERTESAPRWRLADENILTLSRLTPDQAALMLQGLVGTNMLSPALQARIVSFAEGVPLFLEEIAKAAVEHRAEDKYGTVSERRGDAEDLDIPVTLQASLTARLDRLGAAKYVAQAASVVGHEFTAEIVRDIIPLPNEAVDEAIGQLVASEVIFPVGRDGERTFAFKHSLIQEAAYHTVLKRKRRQLHAAVLDAFRSTRPGVFDSEPELAAHHSAQAGLLDEAVSFLTRAARRALSRSAFVEMAGHCAKALVILTSLPELPSRLEIRLDAQILLGASLRAIKGFASKDAELAFLEARQLAHKLDRGPELLDVLRGLSSCYYIRGDWRSAVRISTETLAIGTDRQDLSFETQGLYVHGCVSFWQGRFRDAVRELERSFELYDRSTRARNVLSAQVDPKAFGLCHLAWSLWCLGYPDRAVQESRHAVELARKLAQPYTLALVLVWDSWLKRCLGQLDLPVALLAEMRLLTDNHGLIYLAPCVTYLEGQADIAHGDRGAGLKKILAAIDELRSQGARIGLPWLMSLVAQTCLELQDPERGLDVVAEALADLEQRNERAWEAELYRLKAELLLVSGGSETGIARDLFRRSVKIARSQGALSLELRATVGLARVMDRAGQKTAASILLNDVLSCFEEGFDTADFQEAMALSRKLRSSLDPLTDNEQRMESQL